MGPRRTTEENIMDGLMDGWMDRWTEGETESFFQLHSDVLYVRFCWHFIQHWGLKICSFSRRIE